MPDSTGRVDVALKPAGSWIRKDEERDSDGEFGLTGYGEEGVDRVLYINAIHERTVQTVLSAKRGGN